jgi:transposase
MASKIKIIVTEELQELKRYIHTYPVHLHCRLQMLYLIKSGVTDSTKGLCKHLLVGPRAIQRWKKDYLEGGIGNLLNYKRGKHKSNGIVTPNISAVIKEQLSSPTSGFTSYIELHQWLQENHLPTVTYRVVYHHATVKLNASLKVARKSHIKKDLSAIEDFKKQ